MNTYDVAVIGGGAAGLSAALVLTRARRRVAVVDARQPRNAPASHMQGFLGSDGLPPAALLAKGRAEVAGYGGQLVDGLVVDIRAVLGDGAHAQPGFAVSLADGSTLHARRVLVATGLRDDVPDIPGVRERWGRDLLHCPYCHGYEVRDRPLGVLGGGPDALAHAHLVRQWSDDVVFFADGDTLTADQRQQLVARVIGIVDALVTRLVVPDGPASPASGPRATPSTPVPRSSPPPARVPPLRSPSTTTSSRRTSPSRSPTSGSGPRCRVASPPDLHLPR